MSSPQQRQPMPLSPGVISPTWNGDWFVVLCRRDHRADRVTLVARWLTIHTKIRPNILGRIFVQTTAHTLRGSTNIRPKYQLVDVIDKPLRLTSTLGTIYIGITSTKTF